MMRLSVLLLLTAMIISCANGGTKGEKKESFKIKSPSKSIKVNTDQTNLALAGNDFMQFDKKEFTVTSGKEITLTLRHTGKTAKKIMGHNFVLLKSGTSISAFSAAAASAGETNDWIASKDQIIAHSKMIGGGETTTVTFTAPALGTYDFICSFPGHSGLMRGKFIVN